MRNVGGIKYERSDVGTKFYLKRKHASLTVYKTILYPNAVHGKFSLCLGVETGP